MTRALILRAGLACACAAGLLGPAAQAASAGDGRPVRPLESDAPLQTERLSDERGITRFANAVARAPVRRRPNVRSAPVTRLRHQTEDGPLETYLALESSVETAERTWVRIRIPGRPNGRTGWVDRDDLGPLFSVTTMLRVDRRALGATLYKGGRPIWSSRIGVGKPRTPTPAGRFWIRSRQKGLGDGASYGPWAFGTAAYSVLSDWPGGGVVGIHGTNRRASSPAGRRTAAFACPTGRSAGLARLMPVGTPVRIV